MCRNIKTLFNFDPPVTDEEVRAASLQFVRKITGFNKPSKANEASFLAAVEEVAAISTRLLRSLESSSQESRRRGRQGKGSCRRKIRELGKNLAFKPFLWPSPVPGLQILAVACNVLFFIVLPSLR
jgi:hypothetical protein